MLARGNLECCLTAVVCGGEGALLGCDESVVKSMARGVQTTTAAVAFGEGVLPCWRDPRVVVRLDGWLPAGWLAHSRPPSFLLR